MRSVYNHLFGARRFVRKPSKGSEPVKDLKRAAEILKEVLLDSSSLGGYVGEAPEGEVAGRLRVEGAEEAFAAFEGH